VSPDGLLLTNHHVARGQLQKSSTPEHDYIKDGFYAHTREQEIKFPDLEVAVLISTENVTDRISSQIKDIKDETQQFKARKAAMSGIEQESQTKTGLQSQVVTLYSGGAYWLYRYKRYTDVRIVFAPEQQAAFFGGDPDNFTYPRFDIEFALFRVYENDKPIHTATISSGAFSRLRQINLPRCDIHFALVLRSSERLSHERNHGALEDHLLRPV